MSAPHGLKEETVHKIRSVLAQRPEVEQALLYGSRAKGNYREGSDIDLTLVGGEDLTMRVLYRIMEELDDLLLPYMIDLSIYNHIGDQGVVEHIKRVGIVFYDKSARTEEPASGRGL